MSVMCTMETCKSCKGLCAHEKGMIAMAVVLASAAAGHWMFHWF